MTISRARRTGGIALVCVALLIAIVEIVVHIYMAVTGAPEVYKVSHTDLLVALVIGFVGMYILNPRGAKDGGRFLVDNSIRIIRVVRSGRRSTDVIVTDVVPPSTHRRRATDTSAETDVPFIGE